MSYAGSKMAHAKKKKQKTRCCLGDSKEVGLCGGTNAGGGGNVEPGAPAPFCVVYVSPCCHVV